MKLFAVYVKENHGNFMENAVFVKQGFSFYAGAFQFLWSIYHRMWLTSVLLFALSLFTTYLDTSGILSEDALTVFSMGMIIFIGLCAPDWLEKSLQRRGYKIFDIIGGKNLYEVQKQFYDGYLKHHSKNIIPTLKTI